LRHANDTRAHLGYRWFNQGTGLRPNDPVSDTHHSVASGSRDRPAQLSPKHRQAARASNAIGGGALSQN
jgi:hypothetical protein